MAVIPSFANYQPQMAVPGDDEAETTRELVEALLSISQKTWDDGHGALRSVHAKAHGLLKANLEVLPGLPPEFAQGLFATPARYDVVMRLSTSPGDILSDRVSTPRGVAIKVLDVPGVRLEGSEQGRCQDFLMVNGPVFNAPNVKSFLRSLKLLAATTDRAPRVKEAVSAAMRGTEHAIEAMGGESAKLKAMGGQPATHILGETFYTQLPHRYGRYVAKLQLVPVSPSLLGLKDQPLDLQDEDALRDAVSAYFEQHTAVWELRVQLSTDLSDMPIEDATVRWDEEASPFVTVARLTADRQNAWSAEKAAQVDQGMGFSPWHGIEEHRPLGELMRARKAAYEASQRFRMDKSGCPFHDKPL